MGRLTEQARAQKENAVRAAMDLLLHGQIPPSGKCDVKTLATEAGITRAALYSTYLPAGIAARVVVTGEPVAVKACAV